MSNIRVTYSGLIAVCVGFASVLTGMFFIIIITRRLAPEELGIWTLIGSILTYFLISEAMISYWSVRQIARKKEVGKTAISSSMIFSIGLIPVYIIYVSLISEISSIDKSILMLGVLLLPTFYLSQTLTGINTAHRPQITSYANIIYELIKTPLALVFVILADLNVQGLILTLLFANFIKIPIQFYFARPKLKNQFSFDVLKNWLKHSWIVIYGMLPRYIRKIDIVMFLLLSNSPIGLAYYYVALVVANFISNSNLISQGLYPKLLGGGTSDHIKENFTLTMFIAIPLFAISIIFAKPALFALNPIYQDGYLLVIVFSIHAFIAVPGAIFTRTLKGIESVDTNENLKLRDLIKSNLFKIPTIEIIKNTSYLVLLVGGLILFAFNNEKEFVIWWGITAILTEIPSVIFWSIQVRKQIKFSFPFIEISKYSLSTLAFVIVYFLTSDFIIQYEISIYDFFPRLLLQMIICVGVYVGMTYIIDKKTRLLISKIIKELKT